ncbi:MAG: hypothetical protein MPJ27_10800 [Pirellulales bacterium]|nr:hypothetical protein [Pirellulales bacterium]
MLNLGGAGAWNRREIRERNEMKKAAGCGQLVRMALSCFEATDLGDAKRSRAMAWLRSPFILS